jgi:outer membrane protein
MMKIGRASALILAAAAICLGPPAAAQSDAGAAVAREALDLPVVTIKDAVDSALASGEELKIADAALAAARATYDQARSKKGVSLSASGSYSLTDSFGADLAGPAASALAKLVGSKGATQKIEGGLGLTLGAASAQSQNSKLGLSVSQSIPEGGAGSTTLGASLAQTIWDGYPGGQVNASVEKAAISLNGKELDAKISRSGIVSGAKKAYVTMLTAQRTVALRESALGKQSASLKQIETTYAIQQSSEIDLMSAQVSKRSAELDLETARHDLEIARRKLAALMGRDASISFSVAELDEPDLPTSSIENAIATGLDRRMDARKIALSRRSAAIDLALAKAVSQPSVSGSAGITMGILGGSTPGDAYQASLGVKVAAPILDSGSAKAQVAAAAAQLAAYDAQANQLSRSIEVDIRDAYWLASILRDRIAVAAQAKEMYEKKLELVKTQMQFGTATNQELLSAQADAASYGAAYLKAKGDYLLQEITLETAMGL